MNGDEWARRVAREPVNLAIYLVAILWTGIKLLILAIIIGLVFSCVMSEAALPAATEPITAPVTGTG